MKRSRLAGIVAAALISTLALSAVPAAAQQEPAEGEGYGAIAYLLAHPRVLVRQLNLTADQATASRQLIQSTRSTLQSLRAEVDRLNAQVQEALAQPSPDSCAVGRLVVDRHGKGEEVQAALEDFDDAFAALLTAEQLTRYEALKERLSRGGRR